MIIAKVEWTGLKIGLVLVELSLEISMNSSLSVHGEINSS